MEPFMVLLQHLVALAVGAHITLVRPEQALLDKVTLAAVVITAHLNTAVVEAGEPVLLAAMVLLIMAVMVVLA
jgi:hypothetical protein